MYHVKQLYKLLLQLNNTMEWVNDDVIAALKGDGHNELASNLYELRKVHQDVCKHDEKEGYGTLPLPF